MPALAFGLKPSKSSTSQPKPARKRKALFDTEDHDSDDEAPLPASTNPVKKSSKPLKPLNLLQDPNNADERALKSPRLSPSAPPANGTSTDKYTNLSALRSARLHDQAAQRLDASVYAYDDVYETFNPALKPNAAASTSASGPKYMTSLLTSAEQRKRDLLRAKEVVLQRERENEGEEYVGKESFVTGAYKRQQEEMRVVEEEEKRKMEEEERLRGAGVGMLGFKRELLRKEEERMKGIEEMEVQMERRRKEGGDEVQSEDLGGNEGDVEEKMARDLNEKGAKIVVNDDGEVVDKRQLLSAGLNVAAKKPGQDVRSPKVNDGAARPLEYQKSSQARNAREAQRERQTRMMERQIEEMTVQQEKEKEEEEKAVEEKTKSRITEDAKMSAKERYLQRKKEREQEAKKGG